jgi:hypothetical protein
MFNKHPGGKGDRPILPKDQEQFDNNWDAIFKKKKVDEAGCCNDNCNQGRDCPHRKKPAD